VCHPLNKIHFKKVRKQWSDKIMQSTWCGFRNLTGGTADLCKYSQRYLAYINQLHSLHTAYYHFPTLPGLSSVHWRSWTWDTAKLEIFTHKVPFLTPNQQCLSSYQVLHCILLFNQPAFLELRYIGPGALKKNLWEYMVQDFLQARRPYCCATNSVNAMKRMQHHTPS